MSASEEFWIGLASGVAASVLVGVAGYIFRGVLAIALDSIAGIFARNLRGEWKATFIKLEKGSEVTHAELVTVHQLFHRVWGDIKDVDGGKDFTFKGTLRRNVLVATYERKGNPDDIDRGAFTLLVNSCGTSKSLAGKYAWTDDNTQQPEANVYKWERNGH